MSGVGGRPRIVETPEEFEAKAAEYFDELEAEGKDRPPTIAGIALHMGFASRQSFYDYESESGFSYAVKKARLRIEQHHEERMSGNAPTGSIFWLKNHDWADKQELKHEGSLEVRTVRLPATETDPNAWAEKFRGAGAASGDHSGNGSGQ